MGDPALFTAAAVDLAASDHSLQMAAFKLSLAWAALAAAAAAPGPNMVAVASRGLASGLRPALAVAAGVAVGGFGWAILTAAGLAALFERYPAALQVLGLAGGGYLAWVGVSACGAALRGAAPTSGLSPEGSPAGGWWRDMGFGLLVTATNPKAALIYASLSTLVAGVTLSPAILLMFAAGCSAILFTVYGGYGVLFSRGRVRRLHARWSVAAEVAFGAVFAALGLGMIAQAVGRMGG
ncbi:MAG: LysE family translocator [Pseudomonadota bacterium]